MSKASPEIAQLGNIADLFVPELQNVVNNETSTPADRANLITKVYADFGIFSQETAEQAPELLIPQIEQLIQSNPGPGLEPFVVFNLTDKFGRTALISAFDQAQGSKTYVWDDLWDQYDLDNLNRRTIGGQEPQLGDVRAQILTKSENSYQESGLQATTNNLKEQQAFAKDLVLLNLADYVLIQALRQEAGQSLMDERTYTRFIQMDKKSMGGDSCVCGADVGGGRLVLRGSYGHADAGVGVRLSVG